MEVRCFRGRADGGGVRKVSAKDRECENGKHLLCGDVYYGMRHYGMRLPFVLEC